MSDKLLEEYILKTFQPKHEMRVYDDIIVIHVEDFTSLLVDVRTFITYDYDNPSIWFCGRKICVYSSEEEFNWHIILR